MTPTLAAASSTPTGESLRTQFEQATTTLEAAGKAFDTALEAPRQALRDAERQATLTRNAAQAPAEATLQRLLKTYADSAMELAIEARKCPYHTWGSHRDPEETRVTANGLVLSWEIHIDLPNEYFLATWEALAARATAEGAHGEAE